MSDLFPNCIRSSNIGALKLFTLLFNSFLILLMCFIPVSSLSPIITIFPPNKGFNISSLVLETSLVVVATNPSLLSVLASFSPSTINISLFSFIAFNTFGKLYNKFGLLPL